MEGGIHCRLSSSGRLHLDPEANGALFTVFQLSAHPLGGVVVTGMADGHPVIDHWFSEAHVDPAIAEVAQFYRYVPIFSAPMAGVPFSHLAPDNSEMLPLDLQDIVRFAIRAGWASPAEAELVRAYVKYAWRHAMVGDKYLVRLAAIPWGVPSAGQPARWCRSAAFSSPGSYPMMLVKNSSRKARLGVVGGLQPVERRKMALAADTRTLGAQRDSTPEYRLWIESCRPTGGDVLHYERRAVNCGLTIEEAAMAANFIPNYGMFYGIVPQYGRRQQRALTALHTPVPKIPLSIPAPLVDEAARLAALSANTLGFAKGTSNAVAVALAEARMHLRELESGL